ncbi:MAG: hypothetical protein WAU58_04140, partial [Terriglobales bacterium]
MVLVPTSVSGHVFVASVGQAKTSVGEARVARDDCGMLAAPQGWRYFAALASQLSASSIENVY